MIDLLRVRLSQRQAFQMQHVHARFRERIVLGERTSTAASGRLAAMRRSPVCSRACSFDTSSPFGTDHPARLPEILRPPIITTPCTLRHAQQPAGRKHIEHQAADAQAYHCCALDSASGLLRSALAKKNQRTSPARPCCSCTRR